MSESAPNDVWAEIFGNVCDLVHVVPLRCISKAFRIIYDTAIFAAILLTGHEQATIQDHHVRTLPRNLRSLRSAKEFICASPPSVQLTDSCLCDLPPYLETLHLPTADAFSDACTHLLPARLEYLALGIGLSPAATTSLPATLRQLDVAFLSSHNGMFPSHITSIRIRRYFVPGHLQVSDLLHLQHLQHIHCPHLSLESRAAVAALPPQLVSLRAASIDVYACSSLPRTLVELHAAWQPRSPRQDLLDTALRHMPPSLTSVSFHYCWFPDTDTLRRHFSALHRLCILNTTPATHHNTPTLTHLNILASTLSDTGAALLPRSITRLELDSHSLTNSAISNLPRGITYLKLGDRHKVFTDGCSLHLPPHLTTLHLESQKITDAFIRRLPASITSLHLPSARITNNAFVHLPRGLLHLSLRPTAILTSDTAHQLPPGLLSCSIRCSPHFPSLSPLQYPTDDALAHLPRTLCRLGVVAFSLTPDAGPLLPPRLFHLFLDGYNERVLGPAHFANWKRGRQHLRIVSIPDCRTRESDVAEDE